MDEEMLLGLAEMRSSEEVYNDYNEDGDEDDDFIGCLKRKLGGVKVIALIGPSQLIAFGIISRILDAIVYQENVDFGSDLLKYSAYQCLGMCQAYFFTI